MRSLLMFDLQTLFPIDNTIHQQNNKMKVQDVKKECLATVGLSIEFSNSEVNSIEKLLIEVDAAIEKAIGIQISTMKNFENGCHKLDVDADHIPTAIDLKALKKVQWLLYQLTRNNSSDLFNEAIREYESDIVSINNAVDPNGNHAPLVV